MMKCAALLALLVCATCAHAQVITDVMLPASDPRCAGSAWTSYDKTSSYVSGFSGMTKVCAREYVDICTGPAGLEACNEEYGKCRDVNYDWTDKTLFPNVMTTAKPQVCMSAGTFMTPDVKVIVIAQVIFGLIFQVVAFAMAYGLFQVKGFGYFVAVAQLIMSLMLMFSYYYLNGIVQLAATIAALALFKTRKPALVGVGIAFLFATYFWVTYKHGLGAMQHHERFNANLAPYSTFEDLCNNYYRGYFKKEPRIMAFTDNEEDLTYGFCTRNWLSATLYFEIFAQMMLVALAVAGVQAALWQEPVKSTSDTAPYQ